MKKDKLKQSSKAHTVYKTRGGKIVPGTTTITGLINKPHLIAWANRLGLEGIDSTKYRDEAADVGTLAHALIQAEIGEILCKDDVAIDQDHYSPMNYELARNALKSFHAWQKQNEVTYVLSEEAMVSDTLLYGGTVDCYCYLGDKKTLLDFKTGKAIYDDYFIQLAAYRSLLEEHGYPVDQCRILRIGRDETEGFEERVITDTSKYFEIFKHLLGVYRLKKELKIS